MSGDWPTCGVCGIGVRVLPGGGYACPNGHWWSHTTREGPSPTDPPTLTNPPPEKRLVRVRLEYSDGTYRELSGTVAERWDMMVDSVCTLAEIHHFNPDWEILPWSIGSAARGG
mgnify:CR=1 FL=1